MDFNTYQGADGAVRAAQISEKQITYMQPEGHLKYAIGFVEFRATRLPTAGEWVVYRTGETAFLMTDSKFKEMYNADKSI